MMHPSLLHRAVDPRPTAPGDEPLPDDEFDFNFVSGRLCLDLVSTVGERWNRCFERLRTPVDLRRWAVEAGLTNELPHASKHDLATARALRSAIGTALFAWADGKRLPTPALSIINAAALRADVPRQLAADGRRRMVEHASMSAVLSTVARDAVDLIDAGDPARLRECESDDCSLLMYDASRPGHRRWCSMQACGNRNKALEYRRRQAMNR